MMDTRNDRCQCGATRDGCCERASGHRAIGLGARPSELGWVSACVQAPTTRAICFLFSLAVEEKKSAKVGPLM
jgi:hypothetical protein